MKDRGGGRSRYTKRYSKPVTEQGTPYGGGNISKPDCGSIVFDEQLQKITSAVKSLTVGDELPIRNVRGELKAFTDIGDLCGSIVSTFNPQIIACIASGHSFVAIVKSISSSVYIVTVQMA